MSGGVGFRSNVSHKHAKIYKHLLYHLVYYMVQGKIFCMHYFVKVGYVKEVYQLFTVHVVDLIYYQ